MKAHGLVTATIATITAITLGSCASGPQPRQPVASNPEEITHFRVPVRLPADSTVKLTRFALSTINGSIAQERTNRDRVLVSTQYTREGATFHRQITIVAAVQRRPVGAQSDTTVVELSAWAVDQVEAVRTRTLSGRPIPRLSSNAPIGSSPQDRPYLVTETRSPEDWRTMQDVLRALVAVAPRPRP